MPAGTAFGRLRKALIFEFARRLDLLTCHRCDQPIETVGELSVEHKDAWERADDPVKAFFDLANISFSHLACNSGAASRPNKRFKSRADSIKFHNGNRTYEQRQPEYEPARRHARYLRTGN
jgi:hypothetical protein